MLIISVRTLHLSAREVTDISKLNEAEFDDPALLKLLTKLNVSFEKYEPGSGYDVLTSALTNAELRIGFQESKRAR